MPSPDLRTRIAHALRPQVREQQARDLRKIQALLIASSAGHLLPRLAELDSTERMLRDMAELYGFLPARQPAQEDQNA